MVVAATAQYEDEIVAAAAAAAAGVVVDAELVECPGVRGRMKDQGSSVCMYCAPQTFSTGQTQIRLGNGLGTGTQ